MKTTIPIPTSHPETIKQLVYAAYFAEESITDVVVNEAAGALEITHGDAVQSELILNRTHKLLERFTSHEFAFVQKTHFENDVAVPYSHDIFRELLERKVIKQLDPGVLIFREPFTTLLQFLDAHIVRTIAGAFEAKHEYYPVVIDGSTLNKTNHFTSFPEHIQFVTHLREDLDVIEQFAAAVQQSGGWTDSTEFSLDRSASRPQRMINPATCYHCYEGLQHEHLEGDGVIVTAVSKCHRYESKNHRDFGRLLDFTMREVIFVGKPDFVKSNRLRSIEMLQALVQRWELACHLENANDPFFTSDYEVKASFQRQQEMKYELRMRIPYLDTTISVSSSNFHSNTFGRAFEITAGTRPAVTGCLAFGLERFILAFLSQYGLDETAWPELFRQDYTDWKASHGR